MSQCSSIPLYQIRNGEKNVSYTTFQNVEVSDVLRSAIGKGYLISLRYQNKEKRYVNKEIFFRNSDIVNSLKALKLKSTSRLYLADGLANIDIYEKRDKLHIDYSPVDGVVDSYMLKVGELEKMIKLMDSFNEIHVYASN